MLTEHNSDFLPRVESEEFIPRSSRWTNLGGLFLVATIGVSFTIAAFVKYNVTVRATGTVRPTGELRLVQGASEGAVKSILVKENQVVKQGDAIAMIDDSRLQTQKRQLEGNIQQSQLQLAQITAQISQLDTQIAAESQLMNRTIASAQADLGRNQREYQDRQITAQAEVQEAEAALELANTEMQQYLRLANTGAVTQLQIKQKEQAYKAAQAKLKRAKAGLNPSAAGVAIAQEKIAQEQAKGKSTLATLNKERKALIQRQIEIQNQQQRDRQELKQVGTELQNTIIRTLEAGTILKLELRNPGQVVRPGDAIAQIAPANAPLVVKARVTAADISKVQVCKVKKVSDCQAGKVQMQISAYPYPDYGILKGAVRTITADVITPQNDSAAAYYEVTIQPERTYLVKRDRPYPIQSGMEATADIIFTEETVLTFILRRTRLLTNL